MPPRAAAAEEPIAPNLIGSLVHPDRKASFWRIDFSPDGTRLFAAGYPSGIVQFWDVASRKELRRIETPRGYRGSADYALLTPDWKSLYVPVEKRTAKRIERDGKKLYHFEYSGQIRIWEVPSGKELEALRPAAGSAPVSARLAPDGRFLVCMERPSQDSGQRATDTTVAWDLAARKKWKLIDGYAHPSFAPDGKTVAVSLNDYEAKTSTIVLLDLLTAKELAKTTYPEKGRQFSIGEFSPDGAVVTASVGGKKGAPLEVWFLDAKTLEDRGKLVGKADPERYGWGSGRFTRDGKRYIGLDGVGTVLLWNVAERKVERTLQVGGDRSGWRLTLSPDGKTLAVPWSPKYDADLEDEPDPRDLPQPRVSLIDLGGDAPPRILIAPHGYVGSVAFSPDGHTLALGGAGAVHLFDLTK